MISNLGHEEKKEKRKYLGKSSRKYITEEKFIDVKLPPWSSTTKK